MSIFWINANAGSGKTTYIINQISQLSNIQQALCLTFSNTAAKELNQRINPDFNIAFTLHAFCFQILLKHNPNYKILNKSMEKILWQQALEQAWNNTSWPKEILDHIHLLQEGPKYKQYYGALGELQKLALDIFNNYKTIECLLSFDDILEHTLKLLQSSIGGESIYQHFGLITHLFIDEAQDLSKIQWKLIFALIQELTQKPSYEIYIVGDNKQSIYSFQGACLKSYEYAKSYLQEMCQYLEKTFTEIPLSKTYRCPQNICQFVDKIFKTTHISDKNDGLIQLVQFSSIDELSKAIAKQSEISSDIMILIRKRNQKYKQLSHLLNELGINVEYNQSAVFVEYITLFIETILNPTSDNFFNLMKAEYLELDPYLIDSFYIAKKNFLELNNFPILDLYKQATNINNPIHLLELLDADDEMLEKANKYFNSIPPSLHTCVDFLNQYKPEPHTKKSVRIQTIHQSKGEEAECVFLLDTHLNPNMSPIDEVENDQYLLLDDHPEYNSYKENKRAANLEEHSRLLYVALTRSKHSLFIVENTSEKTSQNSWQTILSQANADLSIATE